MLIQNVSDALLYSVHFDLKLFLMARPTLRDIANKTGYSITTVSRALAGYSDVNEHTRERILATADQLGYEPNQVARQLQGQRTDTIGIILPARIHEADDDFFSILIRGITYAAARNGYDVLISTQPDTDGLSAYRRVVGGKRVDGIIVARTHRNDSRIDYLKSVNVPFVVSGRSHPDEVSDYPFIDADSQYGIRILTEHFIEYGHEHIGLILPPPDIAYTPYRLRGYQEALQKHSIPYREEYIETGNLTRRSGIEAAQQLLDRAPNLTAIIASNDLMALGVMHALQAAGRTVGEDVAVGGFDDIPWARYTSPSLTTLHQPINEIGEQLTELLIAVIQREQIIHMSKLIKPHLIVRDSSGSPRKS